MPKFNLEGAVWVAVSGMAALSVYYVAALVDLFTGVKALAGLILLLCATITFRSLCLSLSKRKVKDGPTAD